VKQLAPAGLRYVTDRYFSVTDHVPWQVVKQLAPAGLRFGVWVSGFGVSGFGVRVSGLGFRG